MRTFWLRFFITAAGKENAGLSSFNPLFHRIIRCRRPARRLCRVVPRVQYVHSVFRLPDMRTVEHRVWSGRIPIWFRNAGTYEQVQYDIYMIYAIPEGPLKGELCKLRYFFVKHQTCKEESNSGKAVESLNIQEVLVSGVECQ
jgi:hypothetical protein